MAVETKNVDRTVSHDSKSMDERYAYRVSFNDPHNTIVYTDNWLESERVTKYRTGLKFGVDYKVHSRDGEIIAEPRPKPLRHN